MKVNERRTVVGVVDWPLCVPPTVERDRRAWFLVSYEQISCRLVKRFPERGHQRTYPQRIRYVTAIISSSRVRTVAYRHRLAAYHNKQSDELSGVPTPMTLNDLEVQNSTFS